MVVLSLIVVTVAAVPILLGVILLLVFSPRPRPSRLSENSFPDPFSEEKRHPFPQLSNAADEDSVDLSLIFPAFREKGRLPPVLTETVDYLIRRSHQDRSFKWEIIIVDDGSRDGDETASVGLLECRQRGEQFWLNHDRPIRVCKLEENRGKGGAVTQGMLRARGRRLLFLDSDGATKIECIERLERSLEGREAAVAVGSRTHLDLEEQAVSRTWLRTFLMHGFHLYIRIFGIRGVADTQCGFKMFTRRAAAAIFPAMHVEGFIFDIELLLCAQFLGVPIYEVPVDWEEKDGSKVDLIRDSIRMARDVLIIRANYLLGLWKKPRFATSS